MARLWSYSLTAIRNYFVGSGGPNNLNSYYRNASYVPTNTANGSIATSGAISIGQFYGSSSLNGWVSATYYASSCSRTTPGSCTASVQLICGGLNGGGSYSYFWSYVSGAAMSINNQYLSNPTISYNHSADGMSYISNWSCVITDADSIQVTLPTVMVEFTYNQNW